MFIVDFTVDHPVLLESLRRVPGIEIEWAETYERTDRPTQMLFWVDCAAPDAAERALSADPAVANPRVLAEVAGRQFYQVDFTTLGDETNLMPAFMEVGSVLVRAIGTNEGWRLRARFPDRSAFAHVYQFCATHDIPLTIDRLFEETDGPASGVALTAAQRDTLIEAVESGYLAIPRSCSQAQLADRLGISAGAASERFRRGVARLIRQTLLPR